MSIEEFYVMAKSSWVVWMMLVFTGIIVWTFLPRNRRRYEEDANIIFKDEPNGGNHG